MADLDLVRRIGAANHGLAIVSVARADRSVHSSLVNAGVLEHPTEGTPVVGMVVGGGTRKLGHLRSAGRATVAFQDGWQWVSVEGVIDIAGPDDTAIVAGARIPELLRDVFRAAGGTHDDWDEYDRVMAAERRAAVLVTAERIVSNQ